MKNSKMITIYRFHPMTIFRGGGYPLMEMTEWDSDLQLAKKAFDEFNLQSILPAELDEMKDSNYENSSDNVWILAAIESATIIVADYIRYLKNTSDIEIVGYACDYDFKTENEKSFMPNGKKVPKKLYQTIYGSQYLKQ